MAKKAAPPPAVLYTGLDLGQVSDPSALAVVERSLVEQRGRQMGSYVVRHLERFHIGTSYTAICDRVAQVFSKPPLLGTTLVVDRTGVGRAVTDMLKRSLTLTPELVKEIKAKTTAPLPPALAVLRPVTITFGQSVNPADGGGWNVPKKELVSTLKVLMQSERFKIVPSLPDAKTVEKELQNFKVKITAAANETFEAWREGDHDDLVLAVAIAVWVGERGQDRPTRVVMKNGGVLRPGLNLNLPLQRWW